MTATMDDSLVYGLGALPSPDDDRDWPVERRYALDGADTDAPLPASYRVPGWSPAPSNQGSTGTCVAHGLGRIKLVQDRGDLRPLDAPDYLQFYGRCGGTVSAGGVWSGLVPRVALEELLKNGYPPVGAPAKASDHRIGAYYRVDTSVDAIKRAILSAGPIALSTDFQRSWYRTPATGVLPAPDVSAGGHLWDADGWDDSVAGGAVHITNSWGAAWGQGGGCWLPYSYLHLVKEAWATSDAPEPPAPKWQLVIRKGSRVQSAVRNAAGQLVVPWRVSGPQQANYIRDCEAPRRLKTTRGEWATVARATSGTAAIRGRFIHLGAGVSVRTAPEA